MHTQTSPAETTPVAPSDADIAISPSRTNRNLQPVSIVPVENRADLDRFIKVPWRIYAGEPNWIPPLLYDQRHQLTKQNPFFQHARAQYWIAYRGTEPAGRISDQVDELHTQSHADATGHYGLVEASNRTT